MSVKNQLKRAASKLPQRLQNELKRLQFAFQIRRGNFSTDELEYTRLNEWLNAGDWAIDVGANIGHYTLKLSSLVGDTGRILSFEPVVATFELLAANVAFARAGNVTLINAASSDKTELVRMEIPTFDTGLDNYYMANISDTGDTSCLTFSIDSLKLPKRVAFVKIDAEGHELHVLAGMRNLLMRDKPILVVEFSDESISDFLQPLGYNVEKIKGSSNLIFTPI